MVQWTVFAMAFKLLFKREEAEAELAKVQTVNVMIVYWVRTVVPCL